jgi:glycolate oxidase iron-sulfur subunit
MYAEPLTPEDFITTTADQCVKCGLCLPSCPTYRLLRNEADSPRGRISLMQGLAQGQLKADKSLLQHLDQCLGCMACEKVCPSVVQYSQLLDTSRDWIEATRHRPWLTRWLRNTGLYLLSRPRAWRISWRLLRLYQRSGLQAVARGSGLLRLTGLQRLDAQLPRIAVTSTPASDTSITPSIRGHIGLFSGCMENIVSATLLQDTIHLLNHAGYDVLTPNAQGCCGALHQHNGALSDAKVLAQHNLDVFKQLNLETVLYLSSGCGATLKEYPALLDDEAQIHFIEAIQFLYDNAILQSLDFKPMTTTIAWFSPCSQRYVTGGRQALGQLLTVIPGLTTLELQQDCCGAAGSYMLSQPDIAGTLRDEVLEQLQQLDVSHLVTANVGCAMHLATGLRQRDMDIEVIHPLTLLARQLRTGLRTEC